MPTLKLTSTAAMELLLTKGSKIMIILLVALCSVLTPGCLKCFPEIRNQQSAIAHIQKYLKSKSSAIEAFDVSSLRIQSARLIDRFGVEFTDESDTFFVNNGIDEHYNKTEAGSGFWEFGYNFILVSSVTCREVLAVYGRIDYCGNLDLFLIERAKVSVKVSGCST